MTAIQQLAATGLLYWCLYFLSQKTRDSTEDGDRYRAANQRLVLGAIAKKILSSDVATMAATIEALSQYVTTDFKIADILALANSLQGLDPSEDIYSAMEPTISEYRNETWYEIGRAHV